jgi:glutamate/tyrosine decarboxylase-like PLP-dependent enzyme
MKNQILKLQEESGLLEPNASERSLLLEKMIGWSEKFIGEINSTPSYIQSESNNGQIENYNITDEPVEFDSLLKTYREKIDGPGINAASGGHLGFIPGGGLFASAMGDWFSAISNKYSGVYFAAPGAIKLENKLIRWLNDIIGYPADASGNLTSGGSVANLIGIVTARDAMGLKARDFERSVIYLTKQAHHSVKKSLKIAGLNDAIIREIPVDENFKMVAPELDKAIKEDRKNGLNPFLVITAAGSTDTGSIDPLSDVGDICAANNLWHHIDAAYGGFFVLSDLVKTALNGIEKSDSLVMDPHKGLFLPYGSGSVLVRDKDKVMNSFYHTANYMQDADARHEEFAPADLSPEMSRHFRAMRMWLPLKMAGLNAFKAALNEKVLLARYFHEKIQKIDGFEVGSYPELSVVTYRYVPKHGNADEFNARLVDEVMKDGRVFLSSTNLNGKFTLRLAVLHFRTHLDTIDLALEVLKEKVEKIRKG